MPELERRMDVAQRVVGLVRSMRAKTNLKTRQPLARIAIPASPETRQLIEQMNDVILEEINVKAIEFIDESSPIVRKTATANFKIIGPKFGKQVNAVAKRIKEMSSAEVIQLDQTGTFSTEVNGTPVTIVREDVTITAQSIEGWLVESAEGLTVALDTTLTPELVNEGLAPRVRESRPEHAQGCGFLRYRPDPHLLRILRQTLPARSPACPITSNLKRLPRRSIPAATAPSTGRSGISTASPARSVSRKLNEEISRINDQRNTTLHIVSTRAWVKDDAIKLPVDRHARP